DARGRLVARRRAALRRAAFATVQAVLESPRHGERHGGAADRDLRHANVHARAHARDVRDARALQARGFGAGPLELARTGGRMRGEEMTATRRDVLLAAGAAALAPWPVLAQQTMPRRPIPATGEELPVIGLGSSKVVQEIAENGTEPVAAVLRTLAAQGGRVVDTWPRDPSNDAGLGRVLAEPALQDLFVTTKIDRVGREAGAAQFRETQ